MIAIMMLSEGSTTKKITDFGIKYYLNSVSAVY